MPSSMQPQPCRSVPWEHSCMAEAAIKHAASAMQECSQGGARSAFFCDCNTHDTNAVNNQLQASTGWRWQNAVREGYDQIYIESGPNPVGRPFGGEAISPHSGRKGCGNRGCQNKHWGYADHPPV